MLISKTPFRVSFAGGMTDIPAFYRHEQGAVLSAAINRHMYIFVNRRFEDGYRCCYSEVEEVRRVPEIKNDIIREALRLFSPGFVDIASLADIPQASGLGSSCSYAVGLVNALASLCVQEMTREELAETACRLEMEILGRNIGKQDQYAAAFGGVNLIEFHPDGTVRVEPVRAERETLDELNRSLMLVYLSGKTKRSEEIIATYDFEGEREALGEMRDLAYEMKDVLEHCQTLSDFGLLLGEEWKLKQQISPEVSTPEIDEVYQRALGAGALSGKICGAGQNGFLLLFVEGVNRDKVRKALFPLREIPFRFEWGGSRVYVE